ncbi:hypothetical protein C6371_11845 [Bacillus atrophaeus]|nr:hypothetical protein C6371_11845 [Bacillus atrophaeus]
MRKVKRKLAKKLKENTRNFLIKEVNEKLKRCEGKGFTYQFVEVEQSRNLLEAVLSNSIEGILLKLK